MLPHQPAEPVAWLSTRTPYRILKSELRISSRVLKLFKETDDDVQEAHLRNKTFYGEWHMGRVRGRENIGAWGGLTQARFRWKEPSATIELAPPRYACPVLALAEPRSYQA